MSNRISKDKYKTGCRSVGWWNGLV